MYIGTVELVGKGFHQVTGKSQEGVGAEGDDWGDKFVSDTIPFP